MSLFNGGKNAREESVEFGRALHAKRTQALRDQFAMAALHGVVARGGDRNVTTLSAEAFKLADAMMKAREQ